MNSLRNLPSSPRRPFWNSPEGKRLILGIFLLLACAVVLGKFFLSSGSDRTTETAPAEKLRMDAVAGQLSSESGQENSLLYGGALKNIQDFEPLKKDSNFWTVVRDVKAADPKVFEQTAVFGLEYRDFLKNPRHYRFLGKPIRVRGVVLDWFSTKAEENGAGVDTVFSTYLNDLENGYVAIGWERPPIENEDLSRAVVEMTGIFYQVVSYESARKLLRDVLVQGLSKLKRGQYQEALTNFQDVLEQDAHPIVVANTLKWFNQGNQAEARKELWDLFKAKGPEYVDVMNRLNLLEAKAATFPEGEPEPQQHYKMHAPLFIAKSIQLLRPSSSQSAFDRFMGTPMGLVTALAFAFLLVGGLLMIFLRLQKSNEAKIKREREDFWRGVRRNIKGVTPPDNPRLSGDRSDPLGPQEK